MKHKKTLIVAMLASLALGGAAVAATAKTDAAKPQASRVKLDANGDGVIDKAEAAKHPRLAERFDMLDKNKDGKLSAEERPQRRGDFRGRRDAGHMGGPRQGFGPGMGVDTDKDGRISRAEAQAAQARFADNAGKRFDQMDANKDGFIDKADHELRAKQRRDEWFAKADTNKDGQLSRAEFDAAKPARMQGPRRGFEGKGRMPAPPVPKA